MPITKNFGRLAGLIFLLLVITGVFAEFYVRQKLFVYDNPVATSQNILENQTLFRLGFVSDLLMSTAFFCYAFVLYIIFKPLFKNLSTFMLLCVVISVAMFCQNALNQYAALDVLISSSYTSAFSLEQLQMLSTHYFKTHSEGYLVNQIFYGLYLFPLGYMIFKSAIVPKIIGIFMILGSLGDLIDFVKHFLFPTAHSVFLDNITIPADLGEFSLCLWLIIMGIRTEKYNVTTQTI